MSCRLLFSINGIACATRRRICVHLTSLLLGAVVVVSSAHTASGQSTSTRPTFPGFLGSTQLPDVIRIVPAAPRTNDSRFIADMAIYQSTRALAGTARWAIAQSDDDVTIAGLLKAFRCALGASVTTENAPRLVSLLSLATSDSSRASNILKQHYQHKRPFQIADGPVCVTAETKANLSRNPDYPSGHTTAGWETGLVLSEISPERTTAILTRARAYGQSRVVCGVHNLSAVEAGWMTATAVFAAQQSSEQFQRAVAAARKEWVDVPALSTVDTAACAAEAGLLANDPF